VPGVADEDDRVVIGGELLGLDVDLGDQRAGRVDGAKRAPRASACTAGETPWAENTVIAPSGIESSSSSTKIAPRSRSWATTCLLWTISLRTYTGGP
jgi:hypothetical protein